MPLSTKKESTYSVPLLSQRLDQWLSVCTGKATSVDGRRHLPRSTSPTVAMARSTLLLGAFMVLATRCPTTMKNMLSTRTPWRASRLPAGLDVDVRRRQLRGAEKEDSGRLGVRPAEVTTTSYSELSATSSRNDASTPLRTGERRNCRTPLHGEMCRDATATYVAAQSAALKGFGRAVWQRRGSTETSVVASSSKWRRAATAVSSGEHDAGRQTAPVTGLRKTSL